MKSVATDLIITANIISSVFTLLVIIGAISQMDRKREKAAELFILTAALTILGSVIDSFSYITVDYGVSHTTLLIINSMTFIMCDIIVFAFLFYTLALIEESVRKSIIVLSVFGTIFVADVIFNVVGTINSKMFYFQDGQFCYGEWSDITEYFSIIMVAVFFVYLFIKRKSIKKGLLFSFALYFLIPIIAAVIEIINPENSFVYTAMSISMMIIYISVEAGEIQKRKIREEMYIELINTDTLTKLRNRRAFEEEIGKFYDDDKAVVIFCDINSLKIVNDSHGHIAGDKLIISFAELLSRHFPKNSIFRISGDEFIVLLRCNELNYINKCFEDFRQDVINHSKIASVGCSNGTGKDIWKVYANAEAEMYKEKNAYYQENNIGHKE